MHTMFGEEKPAARPSLFSNDAAEVRKAAIGYLRTHRDWYVRASLFYQWAWNILTCGIIVLSAISAIASASASGNISVPSWIPVLASAISVLFGTLLAQLRIRDLWQVREQGRIEAETLLAKAYGMPTGSAGAALNRAIELRLEAHALELKQMSGFFTELPPNAGSPSQQQVDPSQVGLRAPAPAAGDVTACPPRILCGRWPCGRARKADCLVCFRMPGRRERRRRLCRSWQSW